MCVCATDKRTWYWHKHQYLGCFWISFCMYHLNKWVGGSTIQLVTKNSGNSKPGLHPSINIIVFWGWPGVKQIMTHKKYHQIDCCLLPRFRSLTGLLNWSRRHMVYSGDFIGSVGLLAVMPELYYTTNMTTTFSYMIAATICCDNSVSRLSVKLCAVWRNQTESGGVGNTKRQSDWSDAGLAVWWCGPWSRGRF